MIFTFLKYLRDQRIAKSILPYVVGNTVLDFGAGDGGILLEIKKNKEGDVLGIERQEYKRRIPVPIILYDGEFLPFSNNFFDTVLVVFVLHHLTKPRFYLEEIKRVAKERIIVVEEVYSNPFDLKRTIFLDWLVNKVENPVVKTPFNFKTKKEWLDIFQKINLSIIKTMKVEQLPWYPTHQLMFVLEK